MFQRESLLRQVGYPPQGFIKWEVGLLYPTLILAEAILWFHPLLVVAPRAVSSRYLKVDETQTGLLDVKDSYCVRDDDC